MTPEQSAELTHALQGRQCYVGGVPGSAAAVMLAALKKRSVPAIVIASDADSAGYMYHDLSRLLGEQKVAFMPSGYRRALKYGQPDAPSRILRTEALNALSDEQSPLRYLVTYPEALAERVASRRQLTEHTLHLSVGASIDLANTEKWLADNGFSRVDYVYEPGQFAIRGSILDIFGYSSELPYRIDLFGDDIESIRSFNVETQLSETRLESASVTADVTASADSASAVSLLEFVSDKTLIVVSSGTDPVSRVQAVADAGYSAMADIASVGSDKGNAEAVNEIVDPARFADAFARFRRLTYSPGPPPAGVKNAVSLGCTPQGIYHKNFDLIADNLKNILAQGYTLYILSDQERQFARLKAIFNDRGDNIDFIAVGSTLHEGFVDPGTRICVFTDHQIFDRFHKYSLRSDRARSGRLAMSLKELSAIEVGDYIVHIDHGVGRFGGLLRTNVGGGHTQEMIKLIYQNDDIVFVSIHSLHKLSKYRGKEGVPPKINKLGSGAWNKLKERTKSNLKDIAADLIRLYATRKEQQGFAFSPDSYLQHELEASFIYEDTPDQLTATRAVKADMESDRPMDRLICGDVGFGKTEIAIRAAFKAATDGKQTAVLVPTTVLAYQHFNTFSERLADFPVRVEYLSRARSAAQTRQILDDLRQGKIDIIIGTHKLISKNVEFKDLGLLVVDEEQKFGVAVKEKLKQLKTNVDTLTMSATPIPRTLQFSLMGARDLSSLNTPPSNRYPILTNVTTLDDEVLSEAINFELSRNGQIFIVNDRIEGLARLEAMVKRLVPDARTVVAHGQMPPEQLEKAIIDFAAHDYDILLATTIVESGIDMPNVNTIIINNAHHFGLSELHQLRGRVGRSSRKAFAYLMVPPDSLLTPVARRRLSAIESFSDLGSGIHIAMQDLDIRGAGNLLGAEQSGFIADLGYETYQKILREAVIELNAEGELAGTLSATGGAATDAEDGTADFVADTVIESDMEVLLPADYVPQESERINLYRELDSIERSDALAEFEKRLIDRFGPIPEVTRQLLVVPRLRRAARRLGIEKVNLKNGLMYIYFVDESNKAYYQSPMFGRLLHFLQLNGRRVKIRDNAGRRSFVISDVDTMTEAFNVLDTALHLPPL